MKWCFTCTVRYVTICAIVHEKPDNVLMLPANGSVKTGPSIVCLRINVYTTIHQRFDRSEVAGIDCSVQRRHWLNVQREGLNVLVCHFESIGVQKFSLGRDDEYTRKVARKLGKNFCYSHM